MSELDFYSSLENVTIEGGISTVKHIAEWEYIRHSSHVLQFHEVEEKRRPDLGTYIFANNDMGEMRHKFEFRLNKDLGYEWILWRGADGSWKSFQVEAVGDEKELIIEENATDEFRFLVFSTSEDPDEEGAVAWFYPESDYNKNGTVGRSRVDKTEVSGEDRRTVMRIVADWRKTNWCRMNLYVRNEGLIAPSNQDPHVYEAFRMEALQFFGSPNEILDAVLDASSTLSVVEETEETLTNIYPNPFTTKVTVTSKNILDNDIKLFSVLGVNISTFITIDTISNNQVIVNMDGLTSGVYFLQVGAAVHKIYKE